MGIGRFPQQDPAESERPVRQLITKHLEPVNYAARKLYQSNPKEFLELVILTVLLVLTLLGEILTHLPWGWYVVVFVYLFGYFLPHLEIRKLFKKKKK